MVYEANYDCEPFNYDQRLFSRSVKHSLDMRLVRASLRRSKREMEVGLSWILVVTLCVTPLALSQNCNGK